MSTPDRRNAESVHHITLVAKMDTLAQVVTVYNAHSFGSIPRCPLKYITPRAAFHLWFPNAIHPHPRGRNASHYVCCL